MTNPTISGITHHISILKYVNIILGTLLPNAVKNTMKVSAIYDSTANINSTTSMFALDNHFFSILYYFLFISTLNNHTAMVIPAINGITYSIAMCMYANTIIGAPANVATVTTNSDIK